MKTIHSVTFLLAIITLVGVTGCKKAGDTPTTLPSSHPSPPGEDVVVASDWFSAVWQKGAVMHFVKNVPQLNADMLKSGRTLVFGKGGFEMHKPTALPANFDENHIAERLEIGHLLLVLQGGGVISNTLQFRYILIPSEKLAGGNSPDFEDYDAVCSYYHVAE
jgi:hypothetical protein